MSSCVIKDDFFYKAAKEHDLDSAEFELLIHKYWNEGGKEGTFPPSSYINQYLGIGEVYDEKGSNVRELWERDYSDALSFKTQKDLDDAYKTATQYFPKDAIVTYIDSYGNHILRVKEPVNQQAYERELQTILDNAHRNEQGQLLAPNGNVSNLNERQYAQVRTKAFKKWFGDWLKVNKFAIDKIDLSKVEIEEYDREKTLGYKSKALKIYLKGQRNKGYFELVKDKEFGQYSVHFKTSTEETGSLTTSSGEISIPSTYKERQVLWEQLLNAIPNGATISTWGTLTDKGIAALNKLGRKGNLIKTGEREVSKKKTGEKVNVPIWQKGEGVSKVVDENGEPLVVYHGSKSIISVFNPSKSSNRQYLSTNIKDTNFFSDDETVADFFAVTEKQMFAETIRRQISTVMEVIPEMKEEGMTDEDIDKLIWESAAEKIGKSIEYTKEFWNNLPDDYKVEEYGILYDEDVSKQKYKVFINARNPVVLDAKGERADIFIRANKETIDNNDEVIILNINETVGRKKTATDYLIRNPNQIKSAVGNNGDFSREDNIYEDNGKLFSRFDFTKEVSLKSKNTWRERAYKEVTRLLPKEQADKVLEKLTEYMDKGGDREDASFTEITSPYFGDGNTQTIGTILDRIIENSQNSDIVELARLAKSKAEKVANNKVIYKPKVTSGVRGRYTYRDRAVSIHGVVTRGKSAEEATRSMESTIVHEIIHAITVDTINSNKEYADKIADIMNELLNYVNQNHITDIPLYALKNEKEFVAEFLSRPAFREALKLIPSKNYANMWQRIINFFNELFTSENSLFNDADTVVSDLLDNLTYDQIESELDGIVAEEDMSFDTRPNKVYTFRFNDGTIITTPFQLNSQQQGALQTIDDFVKSDESVMTLSGYAGTGKTSLMEMVALKLGDEGKRVQFAATTHKAAGVLRSKVGSNFPTSTVDSLFGIMTSVREKDEYDLSDKVSDVDYEKIGLEYGSIVFIDEASMLNKQKYLTVIDIANQFRAKVIFMGDKAQLAPVNEGDISQVFKTENGRVVELTKVERTGDNAILEEATALRNGEELSFVSKFNNEGKGVAYVNPRNTQVVDDIIATYVKGLVYNPDFFRILLFTNREVEKYNNLVRFRLGYQGRPPQVGEPMMAYANWGYVGKNKSGQASYSLVNSESYKVVESGKTINDGITMESGQVVTVSRTPIIVEDGLGNRVEIPFIDVKGNTANRIAAERIAMEKVMLWSKYRATRGSLKKKVILDRIHKLDNFLVVNQNIYEGNRLLQEKVIDFGYAHTIHKSQGSTFTHVLISETDITGSPAKAKEQQQLKYVAVTRATDTVTITSDKTKVEDSPLNHINKTKAQTQTSTQTQQSQTEQQPEKPYIKAVFDSIKGNRQYNQNYSFKKNQRKFWYFEFSQRDNVIRNYTDAYGRSWTEYKFEDGVWKSRTTQSSGHIFTSWAKATSIPTLLQSAINAQSAKIEQQRQVQQGLTNTLGTGQEVQQEIQGAISVAQLGITLEQALGQVQSVFSTEEIAQIKQALNGKNLKVMSVSRNTDPAFFSKQIVSFLEQNAKKPFTDPTRVNCIEIWTKHDGMPIADILEACRKYKVAPMVSFSITGLGNTALESGVMKYQDLIPLIGQLIEKGYLNATTTTVRIDPILIGETNLDDIRTIVKQCKDLGIKKFVTSLVQSYGYTEGTSNDRKVVSGINEALAKEGRTYDWDKYYGRDARGKINFKPKAEYIQLVAEVLLELNQDPEIEIQTCAFTIAGLKASACLDPLIIERVTGVDVTRADKTYDRDTSRPDCMCYGNHSDMFRWNEKKCYSSCAYCYAAHSGDNNLTYYNLDGTLKLVPYTTVLDRETANALAQQQAVQGARQATDFSQTMKGFTLHSGGAIGADSMWSELGKKLGIESKHYYDATDTLNKPPMANTPITDEERAEGQEKATYAGRMMGTIKPYAQVRNPLLIRDWLQAKNADEVFAIVDSFVEAGERIGNSANDDRIANIKHPKGGTGWAVMMAVNEGKPVYVFSQKENQWYAWMGDWKKIDTPHISSENFAGIGTRQINEIGVRAIKDVYNKTVQSMRTNVIEVEAARTARDKGEPVPFDRSQVDKELLDTFDRMQKRNEQMNNVLLSHLIGKTEVREIADSMVNLLSDHLDDWFSEPDKWNDYYMKKGLIAAPISVENLSRVELINKIGIANLFTNYIIPFMSPKVQGYTNIKTARKHQLISKNLDAMLYLAAHTLAANEGVHIVSDAMGNKTVEEGVEISDNAANDNSATDQEVQELIGSLQEKWQIDARTVSTIVDMASIVRRGLAQLFVKDAEGNIATTEFGIQKRVNVIDATNQLLKWCQGSIVLADMIAKLEKKKDANPWVQQLIDRLKGEPNSGEDSDFQNGFFVTFNKHFQNYSATIIEYAEDGTHIIKSVPLNVRPVLKQIIKNLKYSVEQGTGNVPLFTKEGGINKEAYNNLKQSSDFIADLKNNKVRLVGWGRTTKMFPKEVLAAKEAIVTIAAILGYPTDVATVDSILLNGALFTDLVNSSQKITDILGDHLEDKNYSPFAKDGISGYLRKFLEPLTSNLEDITDKSIFEDGKMYQSHVIPSYMTKLNAKVHDEENFEDFIQNEYGKFSLFKNENGWRGGWVQRLADDPYARKVFDHKVLLNYNGANYMKSLTGNQYILSLLSNFASEDAFSGKAGAVAWFRVSILSNKPSEEYIRFFCDTSAFYQKVIRDKIYKVFLQELSRVLTVRMQNYKESDPRYIKNFHKNGGRFCFLDFFNQYLKADKRWGLSEDGGRSNTQFGKMLERKLKGLKVDDVKFMEYALEVISKNLQERAETIMQDWKERGIIKAAENIKGIKEGAGIEENIRKFLWNDFYAATQILQMTITDIAYYKDMEDLQKRLALIHSPGLRGNPDALDYSGRRVSDGLERTLYLSDWAGVKSNIIDNVSIVLDRRIEEAKQKQKEALDPSVYDAEIQALEDFKDSIVKLFEDINVTDAQGYSCPTSYRKKMYIFGKWNRQAEDMYQKLVSGDYSFKDLLIALQPLKPFVYTQIEKPAGLAENSASLPMKNFKVGVQNKNSEYLLIMADALLQNEDTGRPNLLRAIYEMMEESARRNPTRGIDTIQFESTVKAGLMGKVDINDCLEDTKMITVTRNGKKVKRMVGEEKAYGRLLKNLYHLVKDEAGVVSTQYNPTFVHEIPFEDYSLQLEVPGHFREHSQGHGSLIRMITPSDLATVDAFGNAVTYDFKDNGETKRLSAKEFRAEYENTIAENILESIDLLAKELRLNSVSPVERNIVISNMLQNEILSSPRYGLDMFQAVGLDSVTGEFRVPLGDPIHANRIEQLLNSIIKKRVNNQEIAGGPVVQVSNYGTSKRLNIRFKDKAGGELMTREEFMKQYKPRTPGKVNILSEARKIMKEELVSHEKAVKLALERAKAPVLTAEEAYKKYITDNQGGIAYFEVYAPLWASDIFNKFAGPDGTVNMKLLEEVAPEALLMIGYRIPTEDKYSCAPLKIVGFLPKEAGDGIMLPYDITLITGSDFDIDKEYLMRKEIFINTRSVQDTEKLMWPEFLENVKSKMNRKLTKDEEKQSRKRLREYIVMFRENPARYITNPEELRAFHQFIKVAYEATKPTEGRIYRNNKIVDMTWTVLTHQETADKILNPGGFDPQKKMGYAVEVYKQLVIDSDTGLPFTWEKLQSMNPGDIKKALPSAGNLIYTDSLIRFYEQNNSASSTLGMAAVLKVAHACFEGNGYTVNIPEVTGIDSFSICGKTFEGNMVFDGTLNDKGEYIGRVLGSHVAASADAAKEPCMNYLNVSSLTMNVHSALIRLGLPFEDSALLMALPIIGECIAEFNRRNLEDYAIFGQVIMEKILSIREEVGNDGISEKETEPLTSEELIDRLRNKNSGTDYKVLLAFQRALMLAEAIKGPTFITRFNSITTAPGPLVIDNMMTVYKAQFKNVGLYDSKGNPLTMERILEDHPILDKFYSVYSLLADMIFRDSPTRSSSFISIFKEMPFQLYEKIMSDRVLLSSLKDFFMSRILMDNEVIPEGKTHYYVSTFPKKLSESDFKAKWLDNEFVLKLNILPDSNGNLTISLPTTGMLQTEKDRLSAYWYELWKNPEGHQLALDLFYYNFFKGGIGFSPKTFMNLLPIEMREELDNYLNTYRKIPQNCNYVLKQFLGNNTSNNKIFPIVDITLDPLMGRIVLKAEEKEALMLSLKASFKAKDSRGQMHYYLVDGITESEVSFSEIIPLGNKEDYFEASKNDINISIAQIYRMPAKKKQSVLAKGITKKQNDVPLIDDSPSIIPTQQQIKMQAVKVLQSIMSLPGIARSEQTAKAWLKNIDKGIIDKTIPIVDRTLKKAFEAAGLQYTEQSYKDLMEKLDICI